MQERFLQSFTLSICILLKSYKYIPDNTFLNILGPPSDCLSILIQPSDIPLLKPIFELSPRESFCNKNISSYEP